MDTLKTILLSMFGIVFGGLVGFWLGIVRERHNRTESKIMEIKLELLPLLENFITTSKFDSQPVILFGNILVDIPPHYERLKVLVSGRKLKRLESAWDAIYETNGIEMVGSGTFAQFDLRNPDEVKKVEELLKPLRAKLQAFKRTVEKL